MATKISQSQTRPIISPGIKKSSKPITGTFSLFALPPVYIFYAFLLPPEFEIYIGSVRFLAYRIALFASIPWIIINFINGKFKPHILDLFILLSCAWPIFAWMHHSGYIKGLESGGGVLVDTYLAWLVGRIAFSDPHMMGKTLRAILPAVLFIAVIFFIESVGGRLIYRETFQAILGSTTERGGALSREIRLGLMRAYGPFAHPIHGGVIIAGFVSLYLARLMKKWKSISGVLASFAAFFTLSSGAFIALAAGLLLSLYQNLQLRVKELSWPLLGIITLILLLLLEIFSQNGLISIVVRYLSFGGSGWYRTFIWQYCMIEIQNFPLYGIGERPWNRPRWLGSTDTIDAHYLALATRTGVIAAIPLLMAAFWINIRLFGLGSKHKDRYTLCTVIPIAITIAVYNLSAFFVAYWASIVVWYMLLLGAGLTIIQMQSQRKLPHT